MTRIRVHRDGVGGTIAVGTAHVQRLHGTTTTTFTYDDEYLSGPAWSLSPDLPITAREVTVEGLPGAIDDAAPDTWGRNLITRRLAAEAHAAGPHRDSHAIPTPTEADFLLGVADLTRQGALRFRLTGGGDEFLAAGTDVPRLIELPALLDASKEVAGDGADAGLAVEALLAAGSGSLGGARPKASVRDGDDLLIAKFGHTDDRWDVMRWEAVALDLADACGIPTPEHRVMAIGGEPVLLVKRFDRQREVRIPYLSARSLVRGRLGQVHDYLEVAEGIADHGSRVHADLMELWHRIAFSVAINNTDDHLRNHGFLRFGRQGWTLSPIFDINPDPGPTAPRATAIAGATAADASLAALISAADDFGMTAGEAEQRWSEIVAVVSGWRGAATERGISIEEQDRFAPVFDRWSS